MHPNAKRMPLAGTWAALLSVTIVLLISGCGAQQFKTQIFHQTELEGMGPNGMVWNGKDLVLGEGRMILSINSIDTGSYVGKDSVYNEEGFYLFSKEPEPASKDMKICGLAWEGECCGKGFLWIADGLNKEIIKLNDQNEIVKRLPSPGESPNGLAFDGKNLWVADSADSKLYVISPENGVVVAQYNSPVKEPTGLAWDCKNIWVLGIDNCKIPSKDCINSRLVMLNVSSGKVTKEVRLPKHVMKPTSVAWVDGILWVGDYKLNRVFKLSDRGKAVKDDTVYATAVTPRPMRLLAERMSPIEEARLVKDETADAAKRAEGAAETAMSAAEEAQASARQAGDSAESAKSSADRADAAAQKSEKAFELQLKK